MKLQDVLEKFKQQGNYAVSLYYGENIGCDDLNIPQDERKIQIIMCPAGYLGEVRKLVVTNLKELENFDFEQEAKIIGNPPQREEYSDNGVYIWGTESSMKLYLERN
ncbi:hypothetical protein ABDI04_04850 [Bacillus licheniformis]|uniref:hypothetical protein n=1 Tax=Bacillus haynesii TaxID=1925021 RepID=UPI0022827273|nr:hypothetical protein [Bacillus haynesii]MCY8549437.1 hypothetical protein [Bacillus haynesii]